MITQIWQGFQCCRPRSGPCLPVPLASSVPCPARNGPQKPGPPTLRNWHGTCNRVNGTESQRPLGVRQGKRITPAVDVFSGDSVMKRVFLLAILALIMPSLASAANGTSDTSDWRVWSYKSRSARQGDMVLVIAGVPVAASRLGANTTLRGTYEGHDVIVRCQRRPTYSTRVSCNVYADDEILKTLHFRAPL